MPLIETLRQDHALLRNKIALMESALSSAPYARLVFREKCFSLMRVLNRHMKREDALIRRFYERFPSARYLPNRRDHADEHAQLRAVTELLLGGLKVSIPLIILRVSQAIEQLQERMEEQEHTLLPLFEGMTDADLGLVSSAAHRAASISGGMSVNAILRQYPDTERILGPLQINRLREGYESVEELAWRRGLDVSQLLEQLRQAIAASPHN
jgi:hypothetical protein